MFGSYPWKNTPQAKLERLRSATKAALVEARLSLVTAQTVIRWHEDTLKQVDELLWEVESKRQPKLAGGPPAPPPRPPC